LELPLLFYVASLMFFVTGKVDGLVLAVAWTYVALRVIHSAIHLTYNKVMHRLTPFAISNFVLMAYWVVFFIR
ncbi:MAG: MAPEG family protein, partial [Proteobacteria bacterium]|nr:MAPEG family protein [Pseudomonadota bacterium]